MANIVATTKISDQDVYDKIHRKTWSRRFTGMVGGVTHFGAYGAVIGVVAGLLPFLLSAAGITAGIILPVSMIAHVATTTAAFACTGMFMGMATGADVGASAGAGAAVLQEVDKRLTQAGLPKIDDPEAKSAKSAPEKLYNWKVAAFYIPLAAAVGALAALSTITASPLALLGFAVQSPAAIIASATIFAMIGNFYGVRNSIVSNNISAFYTKVSSGIPPLKALEMQMSAEPQKESSTDVMLPPVEQSLYERKSFAADEKRFSVDRILNKTEDQNVVRIR